MSREHTLELLCQATPTQEERLLVHPDGTPIGCIYTEGDRCQTCGSAVMVDLDEYGEHRPGCAAAVVQERVKTAIQALREAMPVPIVDLMWVWFLLGAKDKDDALVRLGEYIVQAGTRDQAIIDATKAERERCLKWVRKQQNESNTSQSFITTKHTAEGIASGAEP